MFIQKIIICNMFAYYGRVEVEFKKQENKNLYCIYGNNGYGKTSFIQCAKILFLGIGLLDDDKIVPQIKSFAKNLNLTTRQFIKGDGINWRGILNESAYKEDKEDFYIEFSGIYDDKNFCIRRSFKKNDSDFSEMLEFTLDKENYKNQQAQEMLNKIMPPNLVEFFFFDGEQIESISNNLRTEFRDKIEEILGIKSLGTAINAIESYQKELKDNESKNKEEAHRLSQLRGEIESIQNDINFKESKIKECESEMEAQDSKTKQLQRQIDKLGADSSEEKANLIREKDELDKNLQSYKTSFKESIKAVIFANNASLIQELENELKDLETKQSQNDIQSYKKLLPELKKIANDELKSLEIDEEYSAIFESVLEALPQKLESKIFKDSFITSDMLLPLKQSLARWERTTLANDISEIKNIKAKLEQNKAEQEELNSDEYTKNKIATLSQERQKAKHLKDAKSNERDNLLLECRDLKNKKDEIEKEIYRLEQNIDTQRIDEKLIILKSLQDSLQNYKARLIDKLRDRLKDLILQNYRKLIRNDNVRGLEIDDDFSIKLKDENDDAVVIENQSSGQKQILAIAIFWALSKLDKSNLPLIIDTPLARIDSENRANIIQNYYANGMQVIILPLNSEMGKKELEYAKHSLSQIYKIENTSDRSHAKIKTAYESEIL